jgi:SOS-response transcriptional repressor LexA
MAGKWQAVCDNFQPGEADEWTESDVKGKNVFALRIKGDSMEPEFREGDVVIVNPHVEAKPGDYVIVKNDAEKATFKQLKKFGDALVLHPLNSKYEDIELKKGVKYRIVGEVVKKEKRY